MPSREPYRGSSRKLVLAFDIGTTHSSISYSILDPGEIPTIRAVSRYPAHEHVGGNAKIPSILYYDPQRSVRAIGAEALQERIIEHAEDEGWFKLEWWKLHLQPKDLTSPHIKNADLPPLPTGISAVQVLADFMRYLYICARVYIVETHASGAHQWAYLENSIEFILTHPDGWQQQQFRCAAEIAGLIPGGDEHASRIHLLTEVEAMALFCVDALLSNFLSKHIVVDDGHHRREEKDARTEQHGVIIIDAGDGIVNLHAYSVGLESTLKEFKQVAPTERKKRRLALLPGFKLFLVSRSKGHLQGFVFVTRRVHAFLKAKLAGSRYDAPEIIQCMTETFDKTTKLKFCDASEPQYIRFGTIRDKDPQYDIRSGQLKLTGMDVAKLFEPSVQAITNAFERQRQAAATCQVQIKNAFLIGSFAASEFLYRSLLLHPAFSEVNMHRPSHQDSRVVADGGVLSYMNQATYQTLRLSRDPG